MGRTGVLTPVAILEPIEIDGSIVSRASLHNVSVMLEIVGQAYKGQKVWIYKANMIIPQIARAEKKDLTISMFSCKNCPICGEHTELKNNDGVLMLYCSNPQCEGKLVNKIEHFFGKKGLDAKGISKATIEKLINLGWVSRVRDMLDVFLRGYRRLVNDCSAVLKGVFFDSSVTHDRDIIHRAQQQFRQDFGNPNHINCRTTYNDTDLY